MIQQILVSGIVISSIYCLLAVGFTLVYGVGRVFNLAHTAFYMVASYSLLQLFQLSGLNVVLSSVASIAITLVIAMLCYQLFIDRVREHEIVVIMITLALALVFQECMFLIFSGRYQAVNTFFPGYIELFGIRVLLQQVLIFGVVVLTFLGVWALLSKTKTGIAIRAISQDREVANLMGINVRRGCFVTVCIGAVLAAIAGEVVAPVFALEPGMWMAPLIITLAVVVVGGLGSVKGSIIGAFILGFAQTLVVFLVPAGSFIKLAIALVVMITVLLVKPEGLFGVVFEEERL